MTRERKVPIALVWIPAWLILWAWHVGTLDKVPAGFFHDEAFNALDALHLPDMGWPLFLPGNFGREPLLVYWMAAAMKVFGPSMWSARLPVALAWGLTMPALYWLARELFPRRGRLLPLLTLSLALTSLWYAIPAHCALRTNLFVLSEILFLAALWRGWNRQCPHWGLVAGFFWGLSFYTYLANRLLPLVFLFFPLLRWREAKKTPRVRKLLLVTVVVALVVMSPLLLYFAHHPQDFLLRTSQVALVGGQGHVDSPSRWQGLAENTVRVLGMFFWHGDENPRNNVPGRPLLTWWSFPLALVALGWTLRRRDARGLFLFWWMGVMLLPTLLSEFAPNFQRAMGAFPPVVLLLAWAGDEVVRRRPRGRAGWAVAALVGLLFLLESVHGLIAFQRWARLPALFYAFDEGLTHIGRYVTAHPPQDDVVYLSPRDFSHPTVRFFLEKPPLPAPLRQRLRSFDARHVLVASPQEDARYITIVHEEVRFELMAPWLWPEGGFHVVQTFHDRVGAPYARVYRVPAHTQLRQPLWPQDARWEDHIRLVGADPIQCCVYRPGDIIYLQLWWTADGGRPSHAWTVFTHLLNERGELVAGKDCEPGCGSYPTTRWHPGEVVVAEYQILIPRGTPPGRYTLEVGLYDWRTGRRLPLAGQDRDTWVVGEVTIND